MRRSVQTPLLALLALVACGSTAGTSPPQPSACTSFQALVAASDYTSSGVGALGADGTETLKVAVDLGGDPALSVSGKRAFFVARDTVDSAIFELDACGVPTKKWSASDPAHRGSSDPQDVAVAPDGALWVPRFNVPSIAIIDPSGIQRRAIDVSSYDDDGNPDASAIAIASVGGAAKAFVALERLSITPDHPYPRSTRPSTMLRIDVATASVEAQITFEGRNPFGLMVPAAGALYLAMPGNFDAVDEPAAGVERFDVATSTTRLLAREVDLGGSVVEVAVVDTCGVAIVADATPNVNRTSLVAFDAATGAVLASARTPLLATEGFDLAGLAWVTLPSSAPVLLAGDRRQVLGRGYPVHAFDRVGTCALRMRPDALFLPQKPVALRAAL